jgi:tRNA (mo5U34)-methyltransferase
VSFAEDYLADGYWSKLGLRRGADLERLRESLAPQLDRPSTRPMWRHIERLPSRVAKHRVYDGPCVTLGTEEEWSDEDRTTLRSALTDLMPWRKGPFEFFGIHVDAEWQSDRKWARVKQHLGQQLAGARILDIGCNNGYYLRRLLAEGPHFVLGIDPLPRYWFYHRLLDRLAPERQLAFDMLGVDDVGLFSGAFDAVLLMGIIYHRRDPLGSLAQVAEAMSPGGLLVLESAGIPGADDMCLFPKDRYMKAKGYWFLPTVSALVSMVSRSGFTDVEVFDSHTLTTDEQRSTPWAVFQSLEDFLDPDDPSRTVEGYPAPIRIYLTARKKTQV